MRKQNNVLQKLKNCPKVMSTIQFNTFVDVSDTLSFRELIPALNPYVNQVHEILLWGCLVEKRKHLIMILDLSY